MEDELYFIKIEDPAQFRKSLLMGVRDVIHSLQKHDDVKRIRTAKAEQVIRLRQLTKEINILLNRLKQDLPVVAQAKKDVQRHRRSKAAKAEAPKQEAKRPGKAAVKELEGQLKDIEAKLKAL